MSSDILSWKCPKCGKKGIGGDQPACPICKHQQNSANGNGSNKPADNNFGWSTAADDQLDVDDGFDNPLAFSRGGGGGGINVPHALTLPSDAGGGGGGGGGEDSSVMLPLETDDARLQQIAAGEALLAVGETVI